MMNRLKKQFMLGLHEGWALFWSPFNGLMRVISALWRSRDKGKK